MSPNRDSRETGPAGPGPSGHRRWVAWVPDLMDRSRLARYEEVEMAGSLAELVRMSPGAAGVLVDLSRPGALEALGRLDAHRVVGFVGHVDRATAEAAQALGCEVVPRSKLFGKRSDAAAVLFGYPSGSGERPGVRDRRSEQSRSEQPRTDTVIPDRPPSATG